MILTDGTNTLTTVYSDVDEKPVSNQSTTTTLGGRPKAQGDSQRLKLKITVRCSTADLATLNSILTNYSASLTYTPDRILLTKTSISALPVVPASAMEKKEAAYNGQTYWYVTFDLEEDIYG